LAAGNTSPFLLVIYTTGVGEEGWGVAAETLGATGGVSRVWTVVAGADGGVAMAATGADGGVAMACGHGGHGRGRPSGHGRRPRCT